MTLILVESEEITAYSITKNPTDKEYYPRVLI